MAVTITVLDTNDNTPTFANVSYNVNLFTDMMPGETVIQVHPQSQSIINITVLEICSISNNFVKQLHFICVGHLMYFELNLKQHFSLWCLKY